MGRLGEFEQVVLFSVLRLGSEASGVAIHDVIREQTGRRVSPGAIYTTLGRLEERGLVRSSERSPVPGRMGRPPKYYELRPAGAKALMKAYEETQRLADGLLTTLAEMADR